MNFSVKALSKGGARAGVLQVGGCSMDTPALLLSTRKGLPAFISPDLLSTLPTPDSRLLQFSPLHFVEGISLKAVSEMGGLHQMLGLKEHVFAANPADPILSVPDHQSSNKIGASFETPSGRFLIKPGQYMEMITSMKPDMWVTLADEVPAWVTDKRNKASVQRTMRWLDDCLTLAKTNDTGGAVFGSIVGGSKINERIYCAQEVSRRNVSGFHIGGFGLGESMDERPALLSAVIDSLPEDKPRQISGLGLPEEVLQGVAAGIDLFNSTYIYHLTIGGFALTFPSEEIERHGSVDQLSDTVRDDGTKINLKATIYSHNTHHYIGFFRKIRDTIREGTFEEFRQKFVESRREHAAPAPDAAVALCA
ncbi:queuine tRNA-ribosyltransferase accessory subunit 2-like isoform X2 [Salvia hispanica]|uniref:queuine tRNA-ribosyltransferase accessory subunit 2-like isoform X2 n=1 Tax=Salvia hispanica TaxID=49212 RepID=UPI0020095623|nr:queuine tRNA-ribosyltransferase accessory subunit 2-like isoform X2 [Salvia hispanica]